MSKAFSPDRAAAAIAARQHGNITRAQLREVGLTERQISHRVHLGTLIIRHRGVFALGHVPRSQLSRAAAGVLACGRGAALGQGSAAALWNAQKHWPTPVEVTVPRPRRPAGVDVHVCTTLTWRDVTTHFGIRVVSPARMLMQMAPRWSEAKLMRAYNDLRHNRHLHPSEVEELVARCRGEIGASRLIPLIELPGEATRSPLEDTFVLFVRRHGLPLPETNVIVHGYRIDAFYRAQKLAVELDGEEYHSDRETFESDRRRDADLLVHGIRTVRITTGRLEHEAETEAARLRVLLGLLVP